MSLSEKLFSGGIFPMSEGKRAPKNDEERDDEAEAICDEMMEQLPRYTKYPEVALLALIRTVAEMATIVDESKRSAFVEKLCDGMRQAVQEASAMEETDDSDDDEDDDESEEEGEEEVNLDEIDEDEDDDEEEVEVDLDEEKDAVDDTKPARKKPLMPDKKDED